MKILLAGSELTPFARSGGLGDVLEALPLALQERGHEVSVVLPCYRGLREDPRLKVQPTGVATEILVGNKRIQAEFLQGVTPEGLQIFLVRRDEYFDRSGLYGSDGRDYADNAERFVFFSKAILELARRMMPPPEILHLHDWQTALVPVLSKERGLPFKTVFTVHNLAYQGSFWGIDFGLTNLPGHYFSENGVEFYGNVNFLKGGLLYADQVTTVSERYAREIQSPEFGCALDPVIRSISWKLSGILNGSDYTHWNPATDPSIAANYSPANLSGKAACRTALLSELDLDPKPTGPVISMVSRLAEQKGVDLLLPVIDRLLADDVRLVILGEGDLGYERELLLASKRHAGRFAFVPSKDERLAHVIQAGSDISLIPSHFEPCGLVAMYSQKYGTLPVARATGGLHQIVQDYDPSSDSGTGFLFFDYQAEAFYSALTRAKRLFTNRTVWEKLVLRAMATDFSWTKAAQLYEGIYNRALAC